MNAIESSASIGVGYRQVQRGRVASLNTDGTFMIAVADGSVVRCEALVVPGTDLRYLDPGDEVLVWRENLEVGSAVVLGKIGRGDVERHESTEAETFDYPMPDEREAIPGELVLEAKHCLTLRVGDGSITIREDGKILIKGKDLVSHAQRMNRIKGGAVSIN